MSSTYSICNLPSSQCCHLWSWTNKYQMTHLVGLVQADVCLDLYIEQTILLSTYPAEMNHRVRPLTSLERLQWSAETLEGTTKLLGCCFRYRFTDVSNVAQRTGARFASSCTTVLHFKALRSAADVFRKTDFFPGKEEHKLWHSCRTSSAVAAISTSFSLGIFIEFLAMCDSFPWPNAMLLSLV